MTWDEADTPYAVDLQLDISVRAFGAGALIRADGLGEWVDPRPILDRTRGARLSTTVAEGCPITVARIVGVSNSIAGLDHSLLPSARPGAGLICVYGGSSSTPEFGLVHQYKLNPRAAESLSQQVRDLPIGHVDGGVESCPGSDGASDLIALRYPGRVDVDLWYLPAGCESVANGHIVVLGSLKLGQ